ncbi:MAG: hypothetical protein C0436_00110 [Alphaproteobacteria bacterium]|nr:hypothetical protein [Alphaproteobacteria bacterium]
MEKCQLHDDIARRLAEAEQRLDDLESEMKLVQVGAAAKDEQIKTIFSVLAEIKQMLKEYTVEMKSAINRLASDIEMVKGRPGRFADGALSAGIAAIVGAAVMYMIRGG